MQQPSRDKVNTRLCIIGAGPAGATLSIFLGKMGIRHLIVDAAVFPRDKVCGDGIDLNTVRVLNHIDPSIVKEDFADTTLFTASQGMRFILPNGKQVEMKRKTENPGPGPELLPVFYVGKRSVFDNLLVSKIDRNIADLRLGTKVTKISRNGAAWKLDAVTETGTLEIEADFLIGADGDHSVLLNFLGERKIDRFNYAGAIRQYWEGITGMHGENLIEIYFPKYLPFSYFWIFPLSKGEANVGFGMASHHIARKNINLRAAFEKIIRTDPLLKERFKNAKPRENIRGWGVPMSGSRRKAHGDKWLLVGDAASIVCPSSGEGIGCGMISAYIAAKFIDRAVKEQNLGQAMFTNYDREIHKRLKPDEKLFRILNHLPPWTFSFLINVFLSSKFIQKRMAKKTIPQWIETAYTKEIKVKLD